jgi:hypothetical protein
MRKINVFIHIGPPKTGTSSIQFWLNRNRIFLKKRGIHYPNHLIDENGVSSGNVRRLFHPRGGKKNLRPIAGSREVLLVETEKKRCHSLLLSSEKFFFQLSDVMEIFPEAKLIAYIRFPLDVIESKYKQSLKRSTTTRPFCEVVQEPVALHLELLDQLIESYGRKKFILRSFSPACFDEGELISDFLSAIGLKKTSYSAYSGILSAICKKNNNSLNELSVVNRSYCFEAMEFKRWLKNFDLTLWQRKIDIFLQHFSESTKCTLDFSLLPPDRYQFYKAQFLGTTRSFVQKNDVDNGEKFINSIEAKNKGLSRNRRWGLMILKRSCPHCDVTMHCLSGILRF